ncbi:hypothetical protein DFO57_101802 [Pantoea sp. AG702]|nr:hypothetical protein DFO57_101802 [Pantoea sp. AG702]
MLIRHVQSGIILASRSLNATRLGKVAFLYGVGMMNDRLEFEVDC